jgi:anti-sigma factor ChrR (cupin superfamily)
MDPKSLFVDAGSQPWRDTPSPGVQFKKLMFDRDSGRSAVLVRFEPGAVYFAHAHPGGEEYYVLEGTVQDGPESYGPGTYVYHPPGSKHRPVSKDGCLLFISLPQQVEPLGD